MPRTGGTGGGYGRRLTLALLAALLMFLGWGWFVLNFSATQAGWWNSIWFFAAVFTLATISAAVALMTRGSKAGLIIAILALVWSLPSLAIALVFALSG